MSFLCKRRLNKANYFFVYTNGSNKGFFLTYLHKPTKSNCLFKFDKALFLGRGTVII